MGRYVTISQEVDVEIDMEDFDTDELVEELQRRKTSSILAQSLTYEQTTLLTTIFEKRRLGADYQTELDELIYQSLGRVV